MQSSKRHNAVAVALALLISVACDRSQRYEWRVFQAPDKTFGVSLPGDAASEDIPTTSATGGSFVSHNLRVRLSDKVYAVSWWEDPTLTDSTAEQVLDTMRDRGLGGSKAQLLDERRFTLQGHPARDITALAAGNTAYDNRLVIAGNRIYSLMIVDGSGKHDRATIDRFFSSLELR